MSLVYVYNYLIGKWSSSHWFRMKAHVFIHVLYLILTKGGMAAETLEKCESKVELRAVLLSCPVKDTGCDDDDPLSQAMAAEEAQIFQTDSKNFKSAKEEKERGYPNAVKDCKRKLIITLKVKNAGKIPCDDEYIVIDHVFDPLTGGRGRLLTPVVLKLRQEQMVQLYGLQFQRVVNNNPYEEQKDVEKICSVDPDNPTCGIATYDGKPIPFSEGFCCSCDPQLNTKRQLSTVSRGDSLLYRDPKLISQRTNRFASPASSGANTNPDVTQSQSESNSASKPGDLGDVKQSTCRVRGLTSETIPNYLIEHDRKIVCSQNDFLNELCKLREEKNKEEQISGYNLGLNAKSMSKEEAFKTNGGGGAGAGAGGGSDSGGDLIDSKPESIAATVNLDVSENNSKEKLKAGNNNLNNVMMLKDLIEALSINQDTKCDSHSVNGNPVSRGKRENLKEPAFSKGEHKLNLEKKLEKFINAKKHLAPGRRKRLLELSHNRFRKIRCRGVENCEPTGHQFSKENAGCSKENPPKYFFQHDRAIVIPFQSHDNSTFKSSDEIDYDDVNEGEVEKSSQDLNNGETNTSSTEGEAQRNHFKNEVSNERAREDQERRVAAKEQEEQPVGKLNAKKDEKVKGKLEANIFKGNTRMAGEKTHEKAQVKSDKKQNVNIAYESKKYKELQYEGHSRGMNTSEERESTEIGVLTTEGTEHHQKQHLSSKNIKNFLLRGDEEKNLHREKVKGCMFGKNKEKLKSSSQKSQSNVNNNNNNNNENNVHHTMTNNDNTPIREHFKETKASHNRENKVEEAKCDSQENERYSMNSNAGNEKGNMKEQQHQQQQEGEGNVREPTVERNSNEQHQQPNANYKYNRQGQEQYGKQYASGHDRMMSKEGTMMAGQGEGQKKRLKSGAKFEGRRNRIHSPAAGQMGTDAGNVDFNFEIIRKPITEYGAQRAFQTKVKERMKNRIEQPYNYAENKGYDSVDDSDYQRKMVAVKTRQHPTYVYQNPQKYYVVKQEKGTAHPQEFYYRKGGVRTPEMRSRQYHINNPQLNAQVQSQRLSNARQMPPQTYEKHLYKTPTSEHRFSPGATYGMHNKDFAKNQRSRQNYMMNAKEGGDRLHGKSGELLKNPAAQMSRNEILLENLSNNNNNNNNNNDEKRKKEFDGSNFRRIRVKRNTEYSFEPARGFLKSELNSENGLKDVEFVHELESCSAIDRKSKGKTATDKMLTKDEGNVEEPSFGVHLTSGEATSPKNKPNPRGIRSNLTGNVKQGLPLSDRERLIRSYANAPDYVLNKMKMKLKGKRETEGDLRETRMDQGGDDGEDTAHCMRFGDMWYSVYMIKKPVVAQIVGIQMFDKHSLCDGTTEWRDLTKGKMIRIGTFLPKAEDELPTISMSFLGGKTKKMNSAIDPDNYLLLIPSHLSDTKTSYSPQFDGGPEEYLVVDSKDVSAGGDCNMIGTSFEAFVRQPDRCSRPRGSCLKRQPVDLWREDMEARIRGKRGKYFVENFGTVPNSPIKTYTNMSGEFLALEYYGEYTSTIEIEVKADFNALVRKGSNAQILSVYIDGTSPKKARIIMSVLNTGLTSSFFRPRLGDCPPDLDPAWCPLEGPLVTIPPQQRHDFELDLSGALPPNKIHVTVQVLNQLNKKIAYRKIIIKKGDRCICAFHCKCNCVGNVDGRTCHKLNLDDYRAAGYIGSFPFRGGAAASASESIRSNIRIIFLTAVYVLFLMGVIKGVLGLFWRRLGVAGTRIIVGPRRLLTYYEYELECCAVLFDECGFPVHPTTCLPVQIVPLWVELFLNFLFFFLYPLRGIWFLIMSLPCCSLVVEMCEGSSDHEEFGTEPDRSPLLSKNAQPSCFNYNMTTHINKQTKGDEHPPYVPYKGDDDPLEEDDTEFVLQEMKRYRKKVALS